MLSCFPLIVAALAPAKYALRPLPIPVCEATINDNADVAGTANAQSAARAFLWNHDRMIWMPSNGLNSYFAGLNNWGQVLFTVVQRNGNVQPFFWSRGRTRALGIPSSPDLQPRGVDNSETVICTTVPPGGEGAFRAFVLWKGSFRPLKLGGSESAALTIGRHGHIVAWWKNPNNDSAHIVILKGNASQELTAAKSGDIGPVWGINDHDEVCGSIKGEGAPEGVAWLGGKRISLGANALPMALNDRGIIVGTAPADAEGPDTTAVVWLSGQRQNLESFVDLNGWHLTKATGINNSGQIVGEGKDPSGKEAMFLLNPIRERASIVRRGYHHIYYRTRRRSGYRRYYRTRRSYHRYRASKSKAK